MCLGFLPGILLNHRVRQPKFPSEERHQVTPALALLRGRQMRQAPVQATLGKAIPVIGRIASVIQAPALLRWCFADPAKPENPGPAVRARRSQAFDLCDDHTALQRIAETQALPKAHPQESKDRIRVFHDLVGFPPGVWVLELELDAVLGCGTFRVRARFGRSVQTQIGAQAQEFVGLHLSRG